MRPSPALAHTKYRGVFQILVSIIGNTKGIEPGATGNALVALVCLFIATFASTWGILAWYGSISESLTLPTSGGSFFCLGQPLKGFHQGRDK